MTQKIDWNYLFIGLLGALFFLPFLGGVHLFDWDEINFAEVSREMIVTNEYLRPQINYEAFWEKPPLFFWLQSISMHIFGVNEYAARFPNAICGIITLVLLYYFGKKIYDKTFGWLWVLSYWGALLPHLYFKSGIIDPWFNLFIFLSYIFLIENQAQNQLEKGSNFRKIPLSILLAGLFSGPRRLSYCFFSLEYKNSDLSRVFFEKHQAFHAFLNNRLVNNAFVVWRGNFAQWYLVRQNVY
jgi:4-amino-4-deoxy-L-arabinose transferase-like glycosyltransferase